MARSLLRDNQIRDADLLTESEHANTVHTDLVMAGDVTVSGTLTVSGTGSQEGKIYCTSVVAENGLTGNIPVVTSIDPDGTVHNATLYFEAGVLTSYVVEDDTYVTLTGEDYLMIGGEAIYLSLK